MHNDTLKRCATRISEESPTSLEAVFGLQELHFEIIHPFAVQLNQLFAKFLKLHPLHG